MSRSMKVRVTLDIDSPDYSQAALLEWLRWELDSHMERESSLELGDLEVDISAIKINGIAVRKLVQ